MATIKVLDADGLPQTLTTRNPNGVANSANSSPVVLASDQAAVQVSGPITNTQAVSLGLGNIGTRLYGTPLNRVGVSSSNAQSAAISATEVMLHASVRCFVISGSSPAATVNSIPLEAGEKFHLRITSGHKIGVLRDTTDGFLNIVPVA